MNTPKMISAMMALMLSTLSIPAAQADVYAPQAPASAYVELNAVQLDQLVAPIALDPDSLVAQILTASTYPDQVSDADNWLNQNMNLPPDQRAAGANNMSWDPAVKGLIEFPAVLDNLAKNSAWASQLGNAYYNQPGDVMNAVQAMRLQAQQSNVLVTTTQQRIVVEAGLIEIVPINPAVIYVPYYNPWTVWGTLFVAYPGFVVLPPPTGVIYGVGLAFDPGISIGVYAGFGWGFGAWAPAWDGGTVLFGGNTYISNSMTVSNHGYFGGHDRGAFDHGGRGVPNGYHAAAQKGAARSRAGRANAGKPSAGHSYGSKSTGGSHSAFGGHSGFGSHSNSPRHSASAGHSGFGGHSASAGRSASSGHSASGGRSASASRSASGNRSASASRSASSSRPASAGRSASGNRSASASRSASAGRSSAANRSASAGHTASANRSASAGRSASANRSASAGRTASASHSASANRSSGTANRGGASGNRGSATANRGASGSRGGSAMASRGGSSAGHSGGGGHTSSGGGHGHGR